MRPLASQSDNGHVFEGSAVSKPPGCTADGRSAGGLSVFGCHFGCQLVGCQATTETLAKLCGIVVSREEIEPSTRRLSERESTVPVFSSSRFL